MHLRLAETSDLPQLASIGAAAFASESIYEHFYPFRQIYPQDFYDAILNTLRRVLVTPGGVIMLAELTGADLAESQRMKEEDHDAQHLLQRKKVVGFLSVVRYGSKASIATWNPDDDEKRVRRQLLDIEQAKSRDRSASPEIMEEFYTAEKKLIGNVAERIDGRSLAILPEFQKRGIGKKLIAWLYSRANIDQVPIFADASTKGISLYLKTGCEMIGNVTLPARTIHVPDDPEYRSSISAAGIVTIRLTEVEVPIILYKPRAPGVKL